MSTTRVRVDKNVGTIILENPARRNALSRQLLDALSQSFQDLHQEKRVRAVVLTGAGDDFCAGLDVRELQQTAAGPEMEALSIWHEDWNRLGDVLEQMLRFPKPIVAAVDGAALGAGLGLALACDLVVASRRATFGGPAVLRGLTAGPVAPLVAFRCGAAVAARLLLSGQPLTSQQLEALGVVVQVTEPDQVWVAAQSLAAECSRGPAEAVQLTKRLLNETIGETLLTQIHVGTAMGATACTTEAAAEGLAAFVEKREPKWP